MKKTLICIGLGLTCLVLIAANIISYRLAHFRGRAEGWSESERYWTRHSLWQKTHALDLMRSGETDAGLQFLDHTLDLDVLIAAGRSPMCCAQQHELPQKELVRILLPIATYRASYARLTYTNDYAHKVEDDVDQLLKDVLKESPNKPSPPYQ